MTGDFILFGRYQEFDIVISTSSEERGDRTIPRFEIKIQEKATKTSESVKIPMNLEGISNKVDVIICRRFAHTKAAESIRQRRGIYQVELMDDALEYLYTALHTALRKHCDSSGSSLWWNFLHDCHQIVIDKIIENTKAQLDEIVGKKYTLAQVADRLKTGWTNFLSEGVSTAHQIDHMNEYWINEYSQISFDTLKEMSRSDLLKLKKDLKFAAMSLDYLSDEDWLGMAIGLTKS